MYINICYSGIFFVYNLQRILLGNTIDILLFQVMYCGIIGNVLFPVWFFPGHTENAVYYHLEYEWSYLYNAWHIFTCKISR